MGQIKYVRSEQDFDQVLRLERAVVFVWVPWSCYARNAESLVEQWLMRDRPPVAVYRVEPDEQPYVARWLTEQGRANLAWTGSGPIVWVRRGRIVADTMSPLAVGREVLRAKTEQAFLESPLNDDCGSSTDIRRGAP